MPSTTRRILATPEDCERLEFTQLKAELDRQSIELQPPRSLEMDLNASLRSMEHVRHALLICGDVIRTYAILTGSR